MILFLNKKDIFETKIKTVSLGVWKPEYQGDLGDYQYACNFVKHVMLKYVLMYVHVYLIYVWNSRSVPNWKRKIAWHTFAFLIIIW